MLTIIEHYGEYKIRLSDGISRGYSIYAKDKEEVVNSVKHYFLMKHDQKKCASCKSKK